MSWGEITLMHSLLAAYSEIAFQKGFELLLINSFSFSITYLGYRLADDQRKDHVDFP